MTNEIELEVTVSEIEQFLVDRIDGVAKAATGSPFLMIKSVNGVPVGPPAEVAHYNDLAKAATDRTLAEGYRRLARKAAKRARKAAE